MALAQSAGEGYQSAVVQPPTAPAAQPPPGAPPPGTLPPPGVGVGTTSPASQESEDSGFNPMDLLSDMKGAGGAGGEAGAQGGKEGNAPLQTTNSGNDGETYEEDASLYLGGGNDPRACKNDGVSFWNSTLSVVNESVIRGGSGYDMSATGWPKITSGARQVDYPRSSKSHCTSATAAAFMQYITDLVAQGKLKLTSAQINFLNGEQVRAAFNGNTYSVAYFNQRLGGQNILGIGSQSEIMKALRQAKPGDTLKFDRRNGTGHSTIFQEIRGNKVCYWSSNRKTNGPGLQCESISSLTSAAVSRFPSAEVMPEALDRMMSTNSLKGAYVPTKNQVLWNSSLTCSSDASAGEEDESSGDDSATEATREVSP